jgi:ribosomal protein S21
VDITPITDHVKPLQVEPNEFQSFEACVKKFRKLVDKDGRLKEVRERARGYKKPSKKKHDKKRRAQHIRKMVQEEKQRDASRRS